LLRHRRLARGPSTGSEDALKQPRNAKHNPRGLTVQPGLAERAEGRRELIDNSPPDDELMAAPMRPDRVLAGIAALL